jgi:ferrochelatase
VKENKSHKFFTGHKNFSHKYEPKVGVIIANLGTPDAPTKEALKVYLREFLNDPRIIEVPRLLWKIILEGIILRTRPKRVAKLYASIWREGGSPLLIYTKGIVDKLRDLFSKNMGTPVEVIVGMRYGNPSMKKAILELKDKGCTKIIFLPLFAQYSSTTVGSAFDGLVDEMKKLRWVPDLRTIHTFHDYDGYIESLASNVKKYWGKKWKRR